MRGGGSSAATAMAAAAINVLGSLAAVCFSLLLLPQIVTNQRRRSTQGFSLGLVLLWHAAALLYLPYLLHQEDPPPSLVVQWVLFSVASVVLEVQFLAFRTPTGPDVATTTTTTATTTSSSPRPASRAALVALAVGATAASAVTAVGLLYLFKATPRWLSDAVGSALCSVLLAAGFLPQLQLMYRTKTSEGFSLGLSALDLTGCTLSIVALLLAPVAKPGTPIDVGGIVPYAVIVGFQILLVFLALAVYPDPTRFSRRGAAQGGGSRKRATSDKEQAAAAAGAAEEGKTNEGGGSEGREAVVN